jgi:DNA-binding MarR family transcriptional regulator
MVAIRIDTGTSTSLKAFLRLLRAHQACFRLQERAVSRAHRLPGPQLRCLAEFADHPELTVKELTRRLGLSHSRLSHVLEWLEAHEMISRHINPADRRIVIVRIAPRGRAAVEALEARLTHCYQDALTRLPRHASDTAIAVLARTLEGAEPKEPTSPRRKPS